MTIKQNTNKEIVKSIRDKLKENGGYCPCALLKTEETKCICKEFRQQIDRGEAGECHCGLYIAYKD